MRKEERTLHKENEAGKASGERKRGKKRRFRRAVIIVSSVLLGMLLLPMTLYIPSVQDFVRRQAESYVEKHTGYRLSFDRMRLSFPLKLVLENADVVTAEGDTLAHCGALRAQVALWPLLRQEVSVRQFGFSDVRVDYADTLTRFSLGIRVGGFELHSDRIDLKSRQAWLKKIELTDCRVVLNPGLPVPDTAVSGPLPDWSIAVGELDLDRIAFAMRTESDGTELSARLETGDVETCRVSLGEQRVEAGDVSVGGVTFAFSNDTLAAVAAPSVAPPVPAADTLPPWTVSVGSVAVAADALAYGILQGEPAEGIDVQHLRLTGLSLSADSVYNRGSDIRLNLRNLSFAERSGLRVEAMHGGFAMDSAGVRLSGFALRTAASSLSANLSAGPGALDMAPTAPVMLSLTADLALGELLKLYPLPDTSANGVLRDKRLRLNADLSGRLDRLALNTVEAAMPGHFDLGMDGTLRTVLHPDRMEGEMRWRGDFPKMQFAKALLPDTALRRRIDLPPFRVQGEAELREGVYAARMNLYAAGGALSADAGFDPASERYRALLRCDSLPLDRFLPADSLGTVTLALEASGTGFDPYAPETRFDAELQVDRFDYRRYDYAGTALTAGLSENRLSGRLTGTGEALRMNLDLTGELERDRQRIAVRGVLDTADLYGMHLSSSPFGFSARLTADAEALPGAWRIKTVLDSTALRDGPRSVRLKKTTLSAVADSLRTEMNLESGDLRMNFSTPLSPDSLLAGMQRTGETMARQMDEAALDMAAVDSLLPPFRLTADAGRDNVLNNFLKLQGMSMGRLSLDAGARAGEPFRLDLMINWLTAGGVRTDTVALSLGQEERKLAYALRLANAPERADIFSSFALEGELEGDRGEVTVKQYDKQGRTGFDFGLAGEKRDSLWKVSMFPERPVLGFSRWTLNPDNYLIYEPPYRFGADFRLTSGRRQVLLMSARREGAPGGSVELTMSDIRIDTLLRMIPGLPPVGGVLQATLLAGMSEVGAGAAGRVALDGLSYEGRRVGDLSLDLSYRTGEDMPQRLYAGMRLDGDEVLTVRSDTTAAAGDGLRLDVAIPAFPLTAANAFLPPDMANLSGTLAGNMRLDLAGTPLLDGWLRTDAARLEVPMIGTAFGLNTDTVRIRRNRVWLDGLALTAPNGKKLQVSGTADLYDFSDITVDLRADASDFQLINVPRNRKSTVFGKANIDLHATVEGVLDALTIRGRANLLGGTEVTYVMRDSPMDLQNKPQNVVTFVSFRDTTDLYGEYDTSAPLKIGGMDLLANLEINEDARMSIFLSDDGNNRIALQGGGNLTYTVNSLGDSRFAGRYTLTGGTVRYNPPVISSKVFDIVRGGYVDWTGDMLDPTLNITAVETVRTNVSTDDGNNSRPVSFNVSIHIRNSLNDLSVTFDLSAPQDLTIQNQLTSMTAEQRSVQAMNMLIYNTYSAPGTSSSSSSGNPLNSFIQKELNQWAQNNLKGVDLSFGIDTYNTVAAGAETSRTDYSYKVSKSLFNNQVRAVIGGKYSSDSDPNENLKENLVDDISLEYMFSRRDNMFLKVFRHTGYESILEGEITETGFGFVTRKKLQRLRDLFRLTRDRRERQENRAKRREEKKTEERPAVPVADTTAVPAIVEPDRKTEDGK